MSDTQKYIYQLTGIEAVYWRSQGEKEGKYCYHISASFWPCVLYWFHRTLANRGLRKLYARVSSNFIPRMGKSDRRCELPRSNPMPWGISADAHNIIRVLRHEHPKWCRASYPKSYQKTMLTYCRFHRYSVQCATHEVAGAKTPEYTLSYRNRSTSILASLSGNKHESLSRWYDKNCVINAALIAPDAFSA